MTVQGIDIAMTTINDEDYISLTDIIKAKDGDFFISDWLRNRNTLEYLGAWESIFNPAFNYGEFAIIKSKARLNNFKISIKEWHKKTNAIGIVARAGRYGGTYAHKDIVFNFCMSENVQDLKLIIQASAPQSNGVTRAYSKAVQIGGVLEAVTEEYDIKEDYNNKYGAPNAAAPKIFMKYFFVNTKTGEKSGEMLTMVRLDEDAAGGKHSIKHITTSKQLAAITYNSLVIAAISYQVAGISDEVFANIGSGAKVCVSINK